MIMDIKEYINKAIKENRSITIKYQKYDGTISTRTLSNIDYSDEYGSGYIQAYCHLRQENRTFKISRIREVDGILATANIVNRTTYTSSTYPRSTVYSSSSRNYTSSRTYKRNEGCYIATMAYGDYNHPQVLILRRYRDQVLETSSLGRLIINGYYFISPKIVYLLKGHSNINYIIRLLLDKIVLLIKHHYFF